VSGSRTIEHVFDPSSRVLDGLEDAIGKVIASERELALPRLRRCIDRLEAAFALQARRADVEGALASPHRSPANVLAGSCRMSHRAARAVLLTGARLESLPVIAGAWCDGEITADHVRVIANASTPVRSEALAAFEPQLLEVARRHPPGALRAVVARICEAIDGDGGVALANDLFERRRLHVSRTLDGVAVLDGLLDPEGAEIVLTAIEHRMADDAVEGTRPMRRADALVGICRRYLAAGGDGRSGRRRRGRPTVSVVVDLSLLEGSADVTSRVRGDLAHCGAVSAETLRRLACDCSLHRVLTVGRSEVLDVGRATRTVSTAQWQALVARDGGCRCGRPAAECEVHHVVHWADGGGTDLDNLVLRCWYCHREEHEGRAPP
jgi:hypothetical protein